MTGKKRGSSVAEDRRGILLPDLEGIDTAEEQVRIAMLKAGIIAEGAGPGKEDTEIYRFQVKRYT